MQHVIYCCVKLIYVIALVASLVQAPRKYAVGLIYAAFFLLAVDAIFAVDFVANVASV